MADKVSIAYGADSGSYLNHAAPEEAARDLIPAAVGSPIQLSKLKHPATSLEVIKQMMMQGAVVDELPLSVYGAGSEGKPRKLDNSDCLVGYEPIYHDLDHLVSVISAVEEALPRIRDVLSSNPMVASMELQDLDKLTQQRWKGPGWFIHAPFSPNLRKSAYPPEFEAALRVVVSGYKRAALLGGPNAGWDEIRSMMLDDFDPEDTSTGMPTLASGSRTMPARLATLRAYPVPFDLSPGAWLDAVSGIGRSLGLPPNVIFASMLATRHGPTRKPVTLWSRSSSMYRAEYESVGLMDRVRMVYPISYPVNFMLSAAYMQLKTSRQAKLGLWHTPEHQQSYIPHLKKQGSRVYTVDFSGMDTTMPPHLIHLMVRVLQEAGFAHWPLQLLSEFYDRAILLMPSFYGQTNSTTTVSKVLSWLSGFKLTSEMDTLFGAATLLMVLEDQVPGTQKAWLDGKFVFLEQGDDILFTLNKELDVDRMATMAMELAGADLKIMPDDALFLKKMMPVVGSISALAPPVSRVLQQTLWNEDRYSGIEGGTKPGALLRLGWLARAGLLPQHPLFKALWPIVEPIFSTLKWCTDASPSYRADFLKGVFRLDEGDEAEIHHYAISHPSFLLKMEERAKYEPSAANFLSLLQGLGVDTSQDLAIKQRRMLLTQLETVPTSSDVTLLRREITWMR